MSWGKVREQLIQLVPIRRLRKYLSYHYGWFPGNMVRSDVIISGIGNLKLGGNVYIGSNGTKLHCEGGVTIGENTGIAGGCIIMSTNQRRSIMAVRTGELRSAEDLIALVAGKPALVMAAKYGGSFLLGLAMGAGRLFSGCGPFGIAVAGTMGTDLPGLLCLAGTLCGYLIAGGFLAAVRYMAAALLVFTAALVFRAVKLSRTSWFMPGAPCCSRCLRGFFTGPICPRRCRGPSGF